MKVDIIGNRLVVSACQNHRIVDLIAVDDNMVVMVDRLPKTILGKLKMIKDFTKYIWKERGDV